MTHTPGPWVVLDRGQVFDIEDGIGDHMARIAKGGWSPDRSAANANLIAAAPDLLDALVRAEQMIRILVLRGVFSGDEVETAENEAANFRALVMKAKGLSQKKKD